MDAAAVCMRLNGRGAVIWEQVAGDLKENRSYRNDYRTETRCCGGFVDGEKQAVYTRDCLFVTGVT